MLGYVLTGPDNGSFMYRGDMNPPVCEGCGLLCDRSWVDPAFELVDSTSDFSYTYDGAAIASQRLADLLADADGVQLVELPSAPGFFLLGSRQIVDFDVEARQTKRLDQCDVCGRFYSVAGAMPVILRSADKPLRAGLSRTDVEFGTGLEQYPLLIVDPVLGERLRDAKLRGLELISVK